MTMSLTVVGLCGSLRPGSFNHALLEAAAELAPAGLSIEPAQIGDLPLYREDLDPYSRHGEAEQLPEPVERLRSHFEAADALLIATPEYNHSVPGVLQNALDWCSRPAFQSPLAGLPAGVIGASTSAAGTARAQEVLKQVLLAVLAPVFPHRGFLMARAAEKITDGRLTDAATHEYLAAYLAEFATFARRFQD